MKRKVSRVGPTTLMVSLPSKWVKTYGIKKGDELNIEESGKTLTLKSEDSRSFERISVDVSDLNERLIKWTISALHKTGYDEIEVTYSGQIALKTIQEMVKEVLMGFAIVDQSDKKVVLRSIAQDVPAEFEATLRRAFLVTLSLAENSLELIKNKKFDELPSLVNLEWTNNQLTNFCERIINKHKLENEKTMSFLYVITWNLEKICDYYKHICNLNFDNKEVNKEVLSFYREVNELLKKFYETFYNFEISKLSNIYDISKNLQVKGYKIIDKHPVLISHIYEILGRITDFSASTIALNLLEEKK